MTPRPLLHLVEQSSLVVVHCDPRKRGTQASRGDGMVSAYILINAAARATGDVLQALRETPGVLTAKAVAGPYDIVADVQAPDNAALGDLITEVIQSTKGIQQTLTCIVFDNL